MKYIKKIPDHLDNLDDVVYPNVYYVESEDEVYINYGLTEFFDRNQIPFFTNDIKPFNTRDPKRKKK